MKKRLTAPSHLLKWTALFLLTFILSLPLTTKPSYASSTTYQVCIRKGYLALRSAKAYSSKNEIGKLYNGDTVTVSDSSDESYWLVYSSKLDKTGYVNKNYLTTSNSSDSSSGNDNSNSSASYSVKIKRGYLALRSAKAYNSKNEIGKLYNGDTVTVSDSSDKTYWYVYSSKLNKSGYVNKNYLAGNDSDNSTSSASCSVKVKSGYLALRSAKVYNSKNEIGKLYNGYTVTVSDSSDATYWYVYSSKLNKSGYVNKNYLISNSSSSGSDNTGSKDSDNSLPAPSYTIKVSKGYLALRSAKTYSSKNEIGKLYNGDTVQLKDSSDDTYWYVYSSKLNKSGYVNKNYLY